MNNIWILCKKELKSYFASPIAYGLMAFFALVFGYFFYLYVGYFVQMSTDPRMMQSGRPMDLNEMIVRPVIMNVSVIGLFIIPLITMRLFAEEKKSGTIELLATSPITDVEIIVGKWLAAVILYACIVGIAALNLGLLFIYGQPDLKPILVAMLGLLLQGSCLLAIGTFISNCTKNQIIAGGATFAISLLLWVVEAAGSLNTSTSGKLLSYLSVTSHFENFSKGVIDLKDVVFFASVIFFGLFLTTRAMESLRWRS